jgi:hypothetical protein
MFRRIDPIVSAGEHGKGAGAEAGAMGRGVDAACEPGHNGKADLAAHRDDRRRIIDHAKSRRIVWLAKYEEFYAGFKCGLQFRFGLLARANTQRARRAATAREVGQGRECRADVADAADEVVEGARADIVAPNEAQPLDLTVSIDLATFSGRMLRPCRKRTYAARTATSIFAMSARSASMFSKRCP